MKRFMVVGLALVAALAFSAMAVSSAGAATPTYKTCGKAAQKNKGNYSDKICKTKVGGPGAETGTGKYERFAGISKAKKTAFKGKNVGEPHNNLVDPTCPKGKFNTTSHKCEEEGKATASEPADLAGTTTCQKEKVTGAVTSETNTEWTTAYSKCEALESACTTKGATKAGEINTDKLKSTLVELNAAETEPGLLVEGLGKKGGAEETGELAQYECLGGALNVEVYGTILAKTGGNLEEANGTTKAFVKEGPLALQSNTYIGPLAAQTEEAAKAFFIWGEKFEKCVAECDR